MAGTAAAIEKKRKRKHVVTASLPVVSLLTPSPPPPDSFVPLSQVPAGIESPEGECFLHTSSVIRRNLARRERQTCRKLTAEANAARTNHTPHTHKSKISNSSPICPNTPESIKVLVRRMAQDKANKVLDPGFCTDCCPYITGDLCSQRFEIPDNPGTRKSNNR